MGLCRGVYIQQTGIAPKLRGENALGASRAPTVIGTMCTLCDLNRHSEHQKSFKQTCSMKFSAPVSRCAHFFWESALCQAVGCYKRNGARFCPGQFGPSNLWSKVSSRCLLVTDTGHLLGGSHPIPTFPRPHKNSQLSSALGPAGSSTAPPAVCRRGAACSRMPRKLFGGVLDTGRPRPLCQLWLLTSFCAVFIPQALSETWPGLCGYREDWRMYKKIP